VIKDGIIFFVCFLEINTVCAYLGELFPLFKKGTPFETGKIMNCFAGLKPVVSPWETDNLVSGHEDQHKFITVIPLQGARIFVFSFFILSH